MSSKLKKMLLKWNPKNNEIVNDLFDHFTQNKNQRESINFSKLKFKSTMDVVIAIINVKLKEDKC